MRATIVDQRCFQSLAKVLMKSAHWAINNGSLQLCRSFQVFLPNPRRRRPPPQHHLIMNYMDNEICTLGDQQRGQ